MDPSVVANLMGSLVGMVDAQSSWLPSFALCDGCTCWLAGPGHKVADYMALVGAKISTRSLVGGTWL